MIALAFSFGDVVVPEELIIPWECVDQEAAETPDEPGVITVEAALAESAIAVSFEAAESIDVSSPRAPPA